jgi:uncharacterized protein
VNNDIEFDWDDANPLTISDFDDEHSDEEARFVSVGRSRTGRLLLVIHTFAERADEAEAPYTFVRLISAREPTAHERRRYEQGVN